VRPGAEITCDQNSNTATLRFDGVQYSRLPRALALDNLYSPLDGNDMLLIVNRISGNYSTGADYHLRLGLQRR
jgi:hypothetical protein